MTDQPEAQTDEYTYTALFEPAEESGYVVRFPAFPNLATQGETLEEARAMAADCLQRATSSGAWKTACPCLQARTTPPAPSASRSLSPCLRPRTLMRLRMSGNSKTQR